MNTASKRPQRRLTGQAKNNAEKTECKYGHSLTDPANVITTVRLDRGGAIHRGCRECGRRLSLASYYRRKQRRPESDGQ